MVLYISIYQLTYTGIWVCGFTYQFVCPFWLLAFRHLSTKPLLMLDIHCQKLSAHLGQECPLSLICFAQYFYDLMEFQKYTLQIAKCMDSVLLLSDFFLIFFYKRFRGECDKWDSETCCQPKCHFKHQFNHHFPLAAYNFS